MFGTKISPNRMPARTHRDERPDKKRHPQSSSSTDIMEGFLLPTRLDITTSLLFCNINGNQKILQKILTIKILLLGGVGLMPAWKSPAAGVREEIAAGPPGCVLMDTPRRYLTDRRKEVSMSTRVLAIMLILVAIAGSQPLLLLHRLLDAGMALLKLFG